MADHVKPTAEELKAEIDKVNKEILDSNSNPTPEKDDTSSEQEEASVTPSTPPEEKVEETPPEETPVEAADKKEDKSEEDIDYKEKFVNSARESQVLHAKNKQINEAIEKANALPDPTEEEMRQAFKEWDVMSDLEKRLATDSEKNKRRFEMLDNVTKESKNIELWNEKVDKFISDPKVLVDKPELEGKAEEFKIFATKPTRRGVDFETLVSSFLYEVGETRKKNKGKMFEDGSSSAHRDEKPKPEKISVEESAKLRETNYDKYRQELKAGRIATE